MIRTIKERMPEFLLDGYRFARKKIKMSAYKGQQVVCPLCASSFSTFAPFGAPPRPNACCPACASLERHRLVWLYLISKTSLLNPGQALKLLHFAPERALFDCLSKLGHLVYFPCDIDPTLYRYPSPVKVWPVDIVDIPFENNTFDVLLCNHVLEHIPDDARAMSELHRVLKPGAWAILQVPIDTNRATTYEDFSITSPMERERAFGQNDHVRIYGRDYPDRLRQAGFSVQEYDFAQTFSKEDQHRYGLLENEALFLCTK